MFLINKDISRSLIFHIESASKYYVILLPADLHSLPTPAQATSVFCQGVYDQVVSLPPALPPLYATAKKICETGI